MIFRGTFLSVKYIAAKTFSSLLNATFIMKMRREKISFVRIAAIFAMFEIFENNPGIK